jgi:hypothetical protein
MTDDDNHDVALDDFWRPMENKDDTSDEPDHADDTTFSGQVSQELDSENIERLIHKNSVSSPPRSPTKAGKKRLFVSPTKGGEIVVSPNKGGASSPNRRGKKQSLTQSPMVLRTRSPKK